MDTWARLFPRRKVKLRQFYNHQTIEISQAVRRYVDANSFRRSPMSKRFEGKTVAITGGNSGIGLATAKLFREEGARVAIAGRDQKTLDEAAKAIGGDTLAVKADVSKLGDIDKFFNQVAAKFGKIDAL